VTLRERPSGFFWLLAGLGLAWIYDSTAFFTGSAFGRHPLWPRISPKKSWEGLVGGTVCTLIAAPLLSQWWQLMNPWYGLILGALVAAVAPFWRFRRLIV
jgi:phosphatidate cytidylyltransferase